MKKAETTGFGKEVRAQLVKLGKTQRQLAQELSMDPTYLSFVLNGKVSGKKHKSEIVKRLNLDLIEYEKKEYGVLVSPQEAKEDTSVSQAAAPLFAILHEYNESQRNEGQGTPMKKRPLTEFGKEVKTQLVKLEKTQKELARELGMGEVYLNVILHGKRSGKKYIEEIAKRLDIDLNALGESKFSIANAERRQHL